MASATFDDDDGGWRRWARYAIPVILVLLAIWAIWTFASQVSGVRREAPAISTIIPVYEPPPPPPPKEPPPPEPKPSPQEAPQPVQPTPQPQPSSPSPAQPTAGQNAVTQNATAQAGTDAFGIGAGLGGGGRGSGLGGGGGVFLAGYSAYLREEIARLVRSETGLSSFRALLRVWIDASGQITRVESVDSADADFPLIRKALVNHTLRSPPAGAPMPVKLNLNVRRN